MPDDTDKAIAFEVAQREACRSCGHRRSDFLDEHGVPLDPPLLMTEVQDCPGCEAITLGSLDLQENARGAAGDGPEAQATQARALAGLSVGIVPYAEVDIAEEVGP